MTPIHRRADRRAEAAGARPDAARARAGATPSLHDGRSPATRLQELPAADKLTWGNAACSDPPPRRARRRRRRAARLASTAAMSTPRRCRARPRRAASPRLVYGRSAGPPDRQTPAATRSPCSARRGLSARRHRDPRRGRRRLTAPGSLATQAAASRRRPIRDLPSPTGFPRRRACRPSRLHERESGPPAWAMTINDIFTGCSSCVRLPARTTSGVGRRVARGRHMHWLRIDHLPHGARWCNQPMLCQHAEGAVRGRLPFNATVPSPTGQQRSTPLHRDAFCSNNCP